MSAVSRCTLCHRPGPHYGLQEKATGLRVALCLSCLQRVARFLSHPRDLERALKAGKGALLS